MAKDYGSNKANLFESTPDPGAEIYGEVNIPSSGRIVAKPIPLDNITPDPRQPRRAIPTHIRRIALQALPATLLELWHKDAKHSAGITNHPIDFIVGAVSPALSEVDHHPTRQLLKLYALAASIHRDGLLNPITIAKTPTGHILETGERRYLAYTLLHAHIDSTTYAKIPARIMDTHDIWRQAHENNNRDDLNPIEKARQLALLYMAMWEDEREFHPYEHEHIKSDRQFYAQAYELNSRRGEGQRLLDAMGVNNRGSITMYKRLLMLTDDEWVEGDANNTPMKELLRQIDEREGTSYGAKETPKDDSYVYRDKHNGDNPPSPTPDTDTLPLQPGVPDGHIEGSVGRIQTVHDQNTVSVLWGGSKIATRHDIAEIFPTDEQVVARAERGESAPVFGDDDTDPPFDITQKQFPSTPTWKDPHQNRVPLQPSDTPIHGGRSGVDVNIHTEPTPDPFKDRITYQRFDRVNTDWGQGVINAIRDSQYHIVTFDPETSTPSTRVMSANDITPLDAPVVGMWALVAESGALGIIERIDSDGSGIDIIIPESNRHLHRSASDIIIEYDYEPDQPQPDTTKPGLDITRVLNILDAFTIIANDPDHNPDHKIANDFIERFNTNQIDTITPDEIDHFLEIMEAELTESYTALIRHLESLKN